MKKPTIRPGAVPVSRRGRLRLERRAGAASNAGEKINTAPKAIAVPSPKPLEPHRPLSGVAGLTMKEVRFIEEYLLAPNATQAAKKAGYSAKSAANLGGRLVRNAQVAAEIKRRTAKRAEKYELSADRVLRELITVGYANMGDYMRPGPDGSPALDFSDLSREQTAALAEVTVEEFRDGRSDKREVRRTRFKLQPKIQALEILAKHLRLITEEVDHRHVHEGSVMMRLLDEIDQNSRGPIVKTIEHDATEKGGA